MTMPSSRSSIRPQSTYLPPHLREFQDNPPFSPRSTTRGGGGGGRRRGGGGGGGGGRGGRGGSSSPNRQQQQQPRSWPRPAAVRSFQPVYDGYENTAPEDFAEKFCELEIAEKEKDSASGGGDASAYDDTPVETSGVDVPAPVTSFSEIQFTKALSDNIKRCKYVKPTPIQRYSIPVAMAGRDVMACAQTGSGKTAAFCFPIISGILSGNLERPSAAPFREACPLALILAPTRELSLQINEEVKKFSYQTGVKVAVAYGGAPIVEQLRNLEKGVDILVATPGRLVDMIERNRVSLKNVKYLTLDEADRMLDMGFEPQIRKLVQHMGMPPPGVRQSLLFSATFPTEIQKLASDFLSNYVFLAAGKVGSSTNLITQKVEHVHDKDKRKHLMDLLRAQRATGNQGKLALTLIFVETKRGADALQQWLSMKDFPSIAIHGDKVQVERERALRMFKRGQTPILVATDVAARGLDIPHVAHVINFDLPRDIDDYVHRIGRTGRAGKSGLATAFFSQRNAPLARALVDLMQEANQEVPTWLNEYAAEASSYNSSYGSTRPSRHGGVKFGGHDYRRESESYNGSNMYADDTNAPNAYASTSRAITYASAVGSEYSRDAGQYYNGFGDNAGVSLSYATPPEFAYHNSSTAGFRSSPGPDSFVEDKFNHSSGAAVVASGGWW